VDLSLPVLDDAARQLVGHLDRTHGGLKGAPKFPMPFVFDFLWRAARRTGDPALRSGVTTTLDAICQGGIYDHLGGGFARYSTDEEWLAPHFEKMLYDNAQLIDLLTLVWQDTRSPLYAARVAETIDWLTREMLTEDGAFAATLDADSEGEEGRFTVWTEAEIDTALGPEAALFKQVYDVTPGGNWEGKTILRRRPVAQPVDEDALARQRAALLAIRDQRVRPGRDDKVLADWNGLMIAAVARAGQVFGRPEWTALARRAFDRVGTLLGTEDGRLGHSYRAGRRQDMAVLDDYANLARAALALFEAEAEADPRLLDLARTWVTVLDARYWDDAAGGYFFTADDATDLFTRTKTLVDAAAPSGNGTMLGVLTRLFLLTGVDAWRHRADTLIGALAPDALRAFPSSATFLNGFELLVRGVQVVITAPPGQTAEVELLRRAALDTGEPALVVSVLTPGSILPPGHPAQGKSARDGQATAYVCRGPVCSLPVTSAEALRRSILSG
jgi:uncharacterized protein YyaL (SSP411 family)